MCELSGRLGIHRPRTKFIDVQKANLTRKFATNADLLWGTYTLVMKNRQRIRPKRPETDK